jgi:hypothetical protein
MLPGVVVLETELGALAVLAKVETVRAKRILAPGADCQCLINGASSGGRRNTGLQSTRGSFKA